MAGNGRGLLWGCLLSCFAACSDGSDAGTSGATEAESGAVEGSGAATTPATSGETEGQSAATSEGGSPCSEDPEGEECQSVWCMDQGEGMDALYWREVVPGGRYNDQGKYTNMTLSGGRPVIMSRSGMHAVTDAGLVVDIPPPQSAARRGDLISDAQGGVHTFAADEETTVHYGYHPDPLGGDEAGESVSETATLGEGESFLSAAALAGGELRFFTRTFAEPQLIEYRRTGPGEPWVSEVITIFDPLWDIERFAVTASSAGDVVYAHSPRQAEVGPSATVSVRTGSEEWVSSPLPGPAGRSLTVKQVLADDDDSLWVLSIGSATQMSAPVLVVSHLVDGEWSFEAVDPKLAATDTPSFEAVYLTVDASGQPHLLYVLTGGYGSTLNGTPGNFATVAYLQPTESGGWLRHVVGGNIAHNQGDIRVDAEGYVHIAYHYGEEYAIAFVADHFAYATNRPCR